MPKFVPVTNPELARHEQDQVRTRPVAARRARATQRRVHPHDFLIVICSKLLGRGGRGCASEPRQQQGLAACGVRSAYVRKPLCKHLCTRGARMQTFQALHPPAA